MNVGHANRNYGVIHSGFFEAFEDVRADLVGALGGNLGSKTVNLTGHSLGGALAAIAALELKAQLAGARKLHILSYGQPRTGDQEFVVSHAAQEFKRFVYGEDLVTRVPPNYLHAGELLRLQESGLARQNPAAESVSEMTPMPEDEFQSLLDTAKKAHSTSRSGVEGAFGSLLEAFFPSIRDHRISNYISSLRRIVREETTPRRAVFGLVSGGQEETCLLYTSPSPRDRG